MENVRGERESWRGGGEKKRKNNEVLVSPRSSDTVENDWIKISLHNGTHNLKERKMPACTFTNLISHSRMSTQRTVHLNRAIFISDANDVRDWDGEGINHN